MDDADRAERPPIYWWRPQPFLDREGYVLLAHGGSVLGWCPHEDDARRICRALEIVHDLPDELVNGGMHAVEVGPRMTPLVPSVFDRSLLHLYREEVRDRAWPEYWSDEEKARMNDAAAYVETLQRRDVAQSVNERKQ